MNKKLKKKAFEFKLKFELKNPGGRMFIIQKT